MVQYEQYEQEVKNLQVMIEDAHRVIQDQPVNPNNIQELQAQIHHHEVRLNLFLVKKCVCMMSFSCIFLVSHCDLLKLASTLF